MSTILKWNFPILQNSMAYSYHAKVWLLLDKRLNTVTIMTASAISVLKIIICNRYCLGN